MHFLQAEWKAQMVSQERCIRLHNFFYILVTSVLKTKQKTIEIRNYLPALAIK